jgi:N-acetylmuramoyl-L-alanine amidase
MLKSNKLKTLFYTVAFSMIISTTANAATYTVTSGDSLSKVGQLFNESYYTMMINNNLSSSSISLGEKLNVPASTYTVKAGDSLYKLSKQFNTSIAWLTKVNGLGTSTIYPGQVLDVPFHYAYTQSDVDLLARLINAEAQGQPYSAQVAVGAVVLNRIKSPLFPKTITNVIYESDQFTPVSNGMINEPATTDSTNAAYAALNGDDPTYGALYYFDTSATNAWLRAKPVALTIDDMIFSY